MNKVFGIDISVHQKNMNIDAAKNEGVKFAIVRAMYGNAKDVAFENNYIKVKNAGLGVGAYQWGRAKTEAQAREEAQLLIDYCLKGKQFDYPIYYDVEDSILINLSVEQLTKVIEAWATTMEKAGYYVGVYMNQSCFNSEVKGTELAAKYTQWRAYWSKKQPNAQMWQFGGETNLIRSNKIAGVVCDQDYAFEDFPTIIKNAKKNGYGSSSNNTSVASPITSKKSSDEIANEVIAGKWGNGDARKSRLANAGYDANAIQTIVNQKLGIKKTTTTAVYHVVKKGEILSKIAPRYDTTVNKIASLNPSIVNVNKIYAGQKIRVK